jgi:Gamma-glutamyl cyclotransferase, AIG2-like
VQRALFGRDVVGEPDALDGYVLNMISIREAAGPGANEAGEYLILRKAQGPAPPVRGAALRLTADELDEADVYETAAYTRAEVTLVSGRHAFVYVAAN